MFPMMMPPPPPRGGAWRWAVIIILLLVLSVSIIFNFILLGASAGGASVNIRQTTIVPGDGQNKIAVVPVEGLIQDNDPAIFEQVLTEIAKDSTVKALVVEIDTPGGSASASDEMYHSLNRFRQTALDQGKKIPIVVAMRGMATSGGYYIACGADYIFAEPGTLTGNIGVLFPRINVSGLMGKYGLQEDTLTANTNGHSFKNAGSMFQAKNPVDEAYLQNLVDQIFAQFKSVVEIGRKGRLKDQQGDIFSGKAFIAQDAKDRGLIDQVDYPEKAYDYAASTAGVSNKTVVRYTPAPPLWMQVFMGAHSNTGGSTAQGPGTAVTVNGINVDVVSIARLITARPLLLWRSN
jgi:protease-4